MTDEDAVVDLRLQDRPEKVLAEICVQKKKRGETSVEDVDHICTEGDLFSEHRRWLNKSANPPVVPVDPTSPMSFEKIITSDWFHVPSLDFETVISRVPKT